MITQPPNKKNVTLLLQDSKVEWIMPLTKSLKPLWPSKLLEEEEEISKKILKLEKTLLLCLTKWKLKLEKKWLLTKLTSLPDTKKPNKYLKLSKLLFQKLKLLPHTPPPKYSWNQPRLETPTQLLLLYKLPLLLTQKLLLNVQENQKN